MSPLYPSNWTWRFSLCREPEIEYPRSSEDYELVGEPIGKGGSAMVIPSSLDPHHVE